MDAEALDALHTRAFGHPGAHGWREADFAKALENPCFAVIMHADGFAIARCVVDEAELMLIATAPEFRRKGAASAILAELEAALAAQGARRLMLEVAGANAGAIAFYRARGFEETGLRHGYYGTGATPGHAAILFEKQLKT